MHFRKLYIKREWGVGSGEWGMGNGEWGVGNGEWGVGSGDWALGGIEGGDFTTPYSWEWGVGFWRC
ncbi:MAG: hypothetical protein DSM106950_29695 [Stigonema ocellatum SAG 48.90 = DSM 106950]|nr:hypothetical protein [Stigonema ocellatum SAG 48.90 = DSM 106950]